MSSPSFARAARAALATVCLSLSVASTAAAAPATVTVSNDRFTPNAVTITAGESVTWNFNESSHNVKGDGWSGNNSFGTGTYTKTFDSAGTFSYVCEAHSDMRGTVTVQAAATQAPAPGTGSGSTPPPSSSPAPGGAPTAAAAAPAAPAWTEPLAQDTASPVVRALRATAPRRARRPRLSLRLTEDAMLVVGARRLGARASAVLRPVRLQGRRGANRFALRIRGLRPGRYRVRVVAVDAAGNESAPRTLTLRVGRR